MRRLVATMLVLSLFSLEATASEWTIFQPVTRIQQHTQGHVYLAGANKWGAASCPNATYAWVKGDVPARRDVLAIVLAAQATGKAVRFSGDCDITDYFVVTDVVTQD